VRVVLHRRVRMEKKEPKVFEAIEEEKEE